MNFESKFVAIAGKSGIGKTTLINNLIAHYPSVFKRPVSYTTRKKRANEGNYEYNFISVDEIRRLYDKGELVNLDYNYGNYYAMDKMRLTREMENRNTILIKEIHPKYHEKIKNAVGENVISVLVRGLSTEVDSRGRNLEDEQFYEVYGDEKFDIVYLYDKDSSIEDNVKAFYHKLMVYLDTMDKFPKAKDIDIENAIGYSKVAQEFTEERRITTRNFHEISEPFWSAFIKELHTGEKVLELGPGNGWLRSNFKWPNVNYHCVDIASSMKSVSNEMNSVVSSARCIPIQGRSVDCVVASLADPYFYPEMLCEVNRILKDEALFAVTLPDKEWADNLRGEGNHKTTFSLDGGNEATVFSFTFTDDEIIKLTEKCGFSICQLTHMRGVGLKSKTISPAITEASEKAKKAIEELKIVTAIILKKRG